MSDLGGDPLSPCPAGAVSPSEAIGDPKQWLFPGEEMLVGKVVVAALHLRVDHGSIVVISPFAGLEDESASVHGKQIVDEGHEATFSGGPLLTYLCGDAVDPRRHVQIGVRVQQERAPLGLVSEVDPSLAGKKELAQGCPGSSE